MLELCSTECATNATVTPHNSTQPKHTTTTTWTQTVLHRVHHSKSFAAINFSYLVPFMCVVFFFSSAGKTW